MRLHIKFIYKLSIYTQCIMILIAFKTIIKNFYQWAFKRSLKKNKGVWLEIPPPKLLKSRKQFLRSSKLWPLWLGIDVRPFFQKGFIYFQGFPKLTMHISFMLSKFFIIEIPPQFRGTFPTFDKSGTVKGTFFCWSRNLFCFNAFAACIFF